MSIPLGVASSRMLVASRRSEERARQDEQADERGGDASAWIQPVSAMTTAAMMTATDPEEVAHDLEVGPAHVEALRLRVAQQKHRDEVRHRGRRPRPRASRPRRSPVAPTAAATPRRGRTPRSRTAGTRWSPRPGSRAAGSRRCGRLVAGRSANQIASERERDARDVGQDVAGIREQGEAVGSDRADHLDDEDREAEQPGPRPGGPGDRRRPNRGRGPSGGFRSSAARLGRGWVM